MKILDQIGKGYPFIDNEGKYPKHLWGNLFQVRGTIEINYVTKDGSLILTINPEISQEIKDLHKSVKDLAEAVLDNEGNILVWKADFKIVNDKMICLQDELINTKAQGESQIKVDAKALAILAEHFTVEDIVRLREKELI